MNSGYMMSPSRDVAMSTSPLARRVHGPASSAYNLHRYSSDQNLPCMIPPNGFLVPALMSPVDELNIRGFTGDGNEFPVDFDPRNAPNMSHKEKVDKWISEVPVYPVFAVYPESPLRYLHHRQHIDQSRWHSDCYPGVVPTSSTDSNGDGDDSQYELDDQYWGVNTRFNESSFGVCGFRFGLFVDREDVLEFQSRKITRYVTKLYEKDTSEPVLRLHQEPQKLRRSPGGQTNNSSPGLSFSVGLNELLDDEYYAACQVVSGVKGK